MLAIGSCKSEKRAARPCCQTADAAIHFRFGLLASIVFNNDHGRLLPTLRFSPCGSGFCMHAAKFINGKQFSSCNNYVIMYSFDTCTEASAPAVISFIMAR